MLKKVISLGEERTQLTQNRGDMSRYKMEWMPGIGDLETVCVAAMAEILGGVNYVDRSTYLEDRMRNHFKIPDARYPVSCSWDVYSDRTYLRDLLKGNSCFRVSNPAPYGGPEVWPKTRPLEKTTLPLCLTKPTRVFVVCGARRGGQLGFYKWIARSLIDGDFDMPLYRVLGRDEKGNSTLEEKISAYVDLDETTINLYHFVDGKKVSLTSND